MTKDNQVSEQDALARFSLTRRTILAAPAAMLLVQATKGYAQSNPPKGQKGEIIIGVSQEPALFHPGMAYLEVDKGVCCGLFNALWRSEPDGTLVPDLAVEIPSVDNGGISADGLTWTIKLREGVKWHDGADFTADDVKFTLELLNNPAFKAYIRQGHSLVKDITVKGPHEVSWTMSERYAPYLALLTWTFIVPKHILEKAEDPNNAPFNQMPVGTGPFKWGSRVAGQGVTVVANTEYFGDGPYVERVVYNYVPDSNVLYTQFETGQIDYISYYGIPPQNYAAAKALPDRTLYLPPSSQVESIIVNFGKPIFQDKAVRAAMYYGTNKQAIVDLIYYGIPTATESFLPNNSWAFNTDLPKHAFDIEAGNKVLEEAGWVKGADGVRAKDGARLEFTAATVSGNSQREQILQLVQQDWAQLGISIDVQTMPTAVVFGDYYTKSQFDCMIAATTYGTGPDPDPSNRFLSTSIPAQGGKGANYYQYKNPEVDKLLSEAKTTFDIAKRKEAYWAVQGLIRDDLAILPLCQPTRVEGTKSKLVGYRANSNYWVNFWNVGSWYWEE